MDRERKGRKKPGKDKEKPKGSLWLEDHHYEEETKRMKARGGVQKDKALRKNITYQARPWGKPNQVPKYQINIELVGPTEGYKRCWKNINIADHCDSDSAYEAALQLCKDMEENPDRYIAEAKKRSRGKKEAPQQGKTQLKKNRQVITSLW